MCVVIILRNAVKLEKNRMIKKKTTILLCFFTALVIISSVYIIIWFHSNKKTSTITENIEEIVEINEVADNENTEILEQNEEIEKDDPYWDFIQMNLINVDFKELKVQNSSTVGWLKVNGTNINYPFVQAEDNEYYLTRSFDKTYNQAGWIFLDYRNNISNLDKNTIIYGHSRLNKTMFGSLVNIFTNGWLNTSSNHVIKISTETENSLWQVFSIYHIPTTSDYLETNFNSNEEFLNFANMLLERSQYNFKTKVTANDKILTLSTCYKDSERAVLHAKLIKKERKS